MHEIRVTIPRLHTAEIVSLAKAAGIPHIAVSETFVYGPDIPMDIVSVETSTPKAHDFLRTVLASAALQSGDGSASSRELRAIIGREDIKPMTCPMTEPYPDVTQDLWQLSHITPSYLARTAGGAALLADGMLSGNPVSIVIGALILPFLSQVTAASFGLWRRDYAFLRHGLKALAISIIVTTLMAAGVAAAEGGPLRFHDFRSPLASFVMSMIIGVAAGLSTADDAGRRFLIGVAAAVQFGIYPALLGIDLVLGAPPGALILMHLESFFINLVTIGGFTALTYGLLHFCKKL